MIELQVVKLDDDARLPEKANDDDAGWDVFYHGDKAIPLMPGEIKTIPTGLCIHVPKGYYFQVEGRGGNAIHSGIFPIAGVMDSGYLAEYRIVMTNNSYKNGQILIKPGMKIAQLILHQVLPVSWTQKKVFDFVTERGENGFGSSDLTDYQSE